MRSIEYPIGERQFSHFPKQLEIGCRVELRVAPLLVLLANQD